MPKLTTKNTVSAAGSMNEGERASQAILPSATSCCWSPSRLRGTGWSPRTRGGGGQWTCREHGRTGCAVRSSQCGVTPRSPENYVGCELGDVRASLPATVLNTEVFLLRRLSGHSWAHITGGRTSRGRSSSCSRRARDGRGVGRRRLRRQRLRRPDALHALRDGDGSALRPVPNVWPRRLRLLLHALPDALVVEPPQARFEAVRRRCLAPGCTIARHL